jgi:hypothetical protein
MGQLANLGRIDLSANLVSSLPCELANLTLLRVLNLAGNDMVSPPMHIVLLGLQAVMEYLAQILRGRENRVADFNSTQLT